MTIPGLFSNSHFHQVNSIILILILITINENINVDQCVIALCTSAQFAPVTYLFCFKLVTCIYVEFHV